MYNHLSEKLTLSNLSKLFFMSESSISNYITLTTGLSFFDLLNEMRVGKTINFLLYTNLTDGGAGGDSGLRGQLPHQQGVCRPDRHEGQRFPENLPERVRDMQHQDDEDAYEIVAYIYRNYAEDLTPQNTADRFNISIKDLNTILLYQVEKNFPDFLNFVRVNRASELLKTPTRQSPRSPSTWASNNAKTLTRNFLRYRTMTPGPFARTSGFRTTHCKQNQKARMRMTADRHP